MKSPLKTDEERIKFMNIVNHLNFSDNLSKIIKIGNRFFKVKELG